MIKQFILMKKKTLKVACWNEESGSLITAIVSDYVLYKLLKKKEIQLMIKCFNNDVGDFRLFENGKWDYYFLISETIFLKYFSDYIVRRLRRKSNISNGYNH